MSVDKLLLLLAVLVSATTEPDPPPCTDAFCASAKVIRHPAFQWTLVILQFLLYILLSQLNILKPSDPNRIGQSGPTATATAPTAAATTATAPSTTTIAGPAQRKKKIT